MNALIIANPLFHNTRDDFTHGHQQTVNILCSLRWRTCIQLAKTRPGADYGSDYQLLIAKFRLKLKKMGKTTKPFRYDLNEIPYDYTVEMMNRFQGLDLVDRMPTRKTRKKQNNYGWRFVTLYRRQEPRPSTRKRNQRRQHGCLKRPYK